MDFKKAFDSLDYSFLISFLEQFEFVKIFITWKDIFLKDQQSCVINGEATAEAFNLERGICEGDVISEHLNILALEILVLLIKKHLEIKGCRNI